MSLSPRSIDTLVRADLLPFKVWRFVPEGARRDETFVKPVLRLPLKSLAGCLVSTSARLAAGLEVAALLGNLKPENPSLNEHFATLTVYRLDGQRFHLARYHDFDADSHGPAALAAFLNLPINEVFPIAYALPQGLVHGVGPYDGTFQLVPSVHLSRAEIIAFAVP